MKKTMMQTIADFIGERTAYGKSLANLERLKNAPAESNYNVKIFLEKLVNAGFKQTGVDYQLRFEIRHYATSDITIQVWIHKAGDLYGVYQRINDNNLNSLIKRLTEPEFRIIKARNILNEAVKSINLERSLEQPALPDAEKITLYEKTIQNAANQLVLAE